MQTTENYGLYLTDDDSDLFIDWRLRMDGIEDSNMIKIDQALSEKADVSSVDSALSQITNNLSTMDYSVTQKIGEVQEQVDTKAPSDSPALTGIPSAPTATAGTSTEQIATTEFVMNAISIAQPVKYAVNLEAALWTGDTAPYLYEVTFADHDNTTDLIELMVGDNMTIEQVVALQAANIVYAEWTTNTTLTLYAYGTKPEIDAPVSIVVR